MNPGQMAVALNAYRNHANEGEAELLSFMRIDLALSPHLPGIYQGEWVWYPSLEHFECHVDVLIPEDVRGYHEWVARGALAFIKHHPTNIQRLQDQLAEIAAGRDPGYPDVPLPPRQTYGDTTLLSEVVEEIIGTESPSLLETLHATEMIIHNYKTQLKALCLEVINAMSGRAEAVEAQLTTLTIRNTPNEIDSLMRDMGRMYLTE
ncbi:hypothetical protein MMC11_008002 [Xylographa trunciseda]|nr:hypothetical protein [Xylographa trunciseda]